jgi:hypothetical protein
MSGNFPLYIELCLNRLDRGENLPDVLGDYPDHQELLKPLLLVAMASRSFPLPVSKHTARRLGKNQMLEEMEILRTEGVFRKNPAVPPAARLVGNLVSAYRSRGFTRLAPSYRLAILALVIFMSGGFLTLTASASSQPGDVLYALKVGLEKVQLALTFTPAPTQPQASLAAEDFDALSEADSPGTNNRFNWIINGITIQRYQDGSPGAEVSALAQTESPPPPLANAQADPGEGNGMDDESDSEEQAVDTGKKQNNGQALGMIKSNPGKALGKDKPKQDKHKDQDKGKDKK